MSLLQKFIAADPAMRASVVIDYLGIEPDNVHMVWDTLDLYSVDRALFIEGVSRALAQNAGNLPAHRAMAWIAAREGRFDEAVRHLLLLIDVLPTGMVERRELLRVGLVAQDLLTPAHLEIGRKGLDTPLSQASYDYQVSRALCAPTMTVDADRFRDAMQQAGEAMKLRIRDQAAGGATPLTELLDVLDGTKRIALVGNGPSLRGAGRGQEIDRYDLVVRCNFPVIENFAADVGSRTDAVLFTEALFRLFGMYLDRDPSYRTARLITIENPAAAAGFNPEETAAAAGTKVARIPAVAMDVMKDTTYRHLTTGAMAYLLLAGLLRKQITIFGFDFYSLKDLHYFSQTAGLWIAHETQYEKFLFRNVVKPVFGAYYR